MPINKKSQKVKDVERYRETIRVLYEDAKKRGEFIPYKVMRAKAYKMLSKM